MKKQSGFTLIELMISAALGVGISWIVLDISVNAMRNNRELLAAGDIVDRGVSLVSLLKRDISQAGFYGRLTPPNIPRAGFGVYDAGMCTNEPTKWNLKYALAALDNKSSFDCGGTTNTLLDSDVLLIRQASTKTTLLADLKDNTHYIQSNFVNAEVSKGATGTWALKEMDGIQDAPIREFFQNVYYLKPDGTFMRAYLNEGTIKTEVLLEGVDDFQVQYQWTTTVGTDYTTSLSNPSREHFDHDRYTEMQAVRSVKVFLLISGDRVSQRDKKTYRYAGNTVDSADLDQNRKRRLFQFTVAVRNQDGEYL